MLTILRIGATDYDHTPSGRPAAGIFGMRLEISVETGAMLTFQVKVCGADAPFVPGVEVRLTTTDDDGLNPVLRFVGDLDAPQLANSSEGYVWAYSCTDLKHRANWVTVSGVDGTGTASFNLTPDDPLALYALTGQTVGAIVSAILKAPANAAALNGYGVGAYTSLSPPTLPAATVADLAALTIVPATPVQLRGESLLNSIESLILRWHPQYALWVEPTGTIRVRSIFGFTPRTITVPTNADDGDPVDWPTYSGPDCRGCFTAFKIVGLDIQRAVLSLSAGTLVKAWTDANQTSWTYDDFLMPKDASDEGSCTVTSSSATVHSDQADHFWTLNFWNDSNRQGWIYLYYSGGSGIAMHEERQITSCTALTAGGSATITWDSSLPLASTSYDRYRIVGRNSPKALVSRKFFAREPVGNLVGAASYVGSHLYPRFPKGAWLANLSSTQQIFYPTAVVRWSSTGDYPWFEIPVKCQVDPRDGSITLTEPAVGKFGDPGVLDAGYPTTFADGLPADILVFVPYNRGNLYARSPTSGHSGQANALYGIQREKTVFLDEFTWNGDTVSLQALAAEHLAVVKDPVIEGSVLHHGIPASFDPFALGYSLDVITPGQTTRLDGINLPVRTVVVDWPETGDLHTVGMQFSTLKRPFQGDDLYIHPGLSGESFGTDYDLWSPGFGSMDMSDYNSIASEAGQMQTPDSSPLSEAMQNNPMADQGNPLSDLAGASPIADAMSDFGQQGADMDFGDFGDFGSFSADTAGSSPGDRRSDRQKATDRRAADRREAGEKHAAHRQEMRDPEKARAQARADEQARRDVQRRHRAAQDAQAGPSTGQPIDLTQPDPESRLSRRRGINPDDINGGG